MLLNPEMDIVKGLTAAAVDLLYPPRCLACDALAEPFCCRCRAAIRPVGEDGPLPLGIDSAAAAGYHEGPLRHAVLRLKFDRKVVLARPLGELIAAAVETRRAEWQPDVLVPVPIHWTRRLERGFNQSELLALEVSRRCNLPRLAALKRIRPTPRQTGLSGDVRRENLRGAFAAVPDVPVAGLRVVLLDDVRTTGATLEECAAALRTAGAAAVFAATVSVGGQTQDP
jgi:competence protein ComFC